MRTILIALTVALASVGAAAQTTEGAAEPTEQRTWSERISGWIQRISGWAPTGEVRELEAELVELTIALEQREDAVQRGEEAVRQQAARNRRRGAELRDQAAALQQREEQVEKDTTNALLQVEQIRNRSVGIAWTAVVLGGGLGFWSLWRLQPSTVARLNQRRRAAEQGLEAMRGERDDARAQLRKRASALTAAKRKNTLLRHALDGAEARCRNAVAAAEETKKINTGLQHALDGTETRRREAQVTIIRLRVDLDNAKATISSLRVDLEDAKREAKEAAESRDNRECMAQQVLGVPAGASRDDVKAAWKRLMLTVHPDRNPGPEAKRLTQLAQDARGWLGSG